MKSVVAAFAFSLSLVAHAQELEGPPEKPSSKGADIVFMVDLSGSMNDAFLAAKQVMHAFASEQVRGREGASVRVGFLLYGDRQRYELFPLTENLDAAERFLTGLATRNIGQEFVPDILERVESTFDWRAEADRHLVIVGNETPFQGKKNPIEAMSKVSELGIVGSVVWCTNSFSRDGSNPGQRESRDQERSQWQDVARRGGGFFFELDMGPAIRQQAARAERAEFERRLAEYLKQQQVRQAMAMARSKPRGG